MNVAAVQFKARKGDFAESMTRLCVLTERAAQDMHLVVLPEMAATGYVFETAQIARAVAEPPEGPTYQALAPIAATHGCWIVCGFPERAGERLYNSALVIGPDGALRSTYRKTLLFDADLPWATPGDSGYRLFETGAGSFTVGICMDLNDDRFIDWVIQAAPLALAFPTNWTEEGVDIWPYWAWRMDGSDTALVAANTYGSDAHIRFHGRSAVIWRRTVLAAAPPTGDDVLQAKLEEPVE